MSDIKCPFCNKKLEPIGTSGQFQCGTWGCDASFNFIATRDVWEYIDRTRKALEWARHFLKEIRLRYLIEKDSPSRQNKWADTALYMYNLTESFFDDYDKTNETKGGDNE